MGVAHPLSLQFGDYPPSAKVWIPTTLWQRGGLKSKPERATYLPISAIPMRRSARSRSNSQTLTQARAAELLGIVQPHVSDLVRYRLNRFSVERLMQFLTHLGKDVEIRIAKRTARRTRPAVRILHTA